MKKLKESLAGRTHVFWVICLPVILILYFVPEKLITADYFNTAIALDDLIPFVSPFIVAYLLWFPMLALTGLWLLFRDGNAFRRYMWFLTAAYAVSAVIFFIFPNGQDLRPQSFENENFFTYICSLIYSVDTNTNVLPSLHVVASFGVIFAVYDTPTLPSRAVRALAVILALLVCASTVLVKQHAVMDLVASALLSAVLYLIFYKLVKKKMKKSL